MYLLLHFYKNHLQLLFTNGAMQILFYFFKPLIPNETKYFNVPATKEKKRGGGRKICCK